MQQAWLISANEKISGFPVDMEKPVVHYNRLVGL